jgi:phenylpropionate dioxygenase-like ring-hydroxylating dioxygenase large terminal subunit
MEEERMTVEAAAEGRIADEADVEVAYRRAWFPVARAEDLAEGPVAVRLLGESLVAYRGGDRGLVVMRNRCAHRGAQLSLGKIVGNDIQCPYHGWRYDATGRCALIPSAGEGAPIPPGAKVDSFPTVERFGLVWTCLEPVGLEVPSPPELAEFDTWNWALAEPITNTVGIRNVIENFRDVAHFSFVHEPSMGQIDPRIDPLDVDRDGYEARMRYEYKAAGGYEEVWHDMSFAYHAMAPAFIYVSLDTHEGARHVLVAAQPVAERESIVYYLTAIEPGWQGVSLDEALRHEKIIMAEDVRITGTLDPWEAPLFGSPGEVHCPADKFTLAYRRAFAEWARDVAAMPPRDNGSAASVAPSPEPAPVVP